MVRPTPPTVRFSQGWRGTAASYGRGATSGLMGGLLKVRGLVDSHDAGPRWEVSRSLDAVQPSLEFLQVLVVFLDLGKGVMVGKKLFGDLALVVLTFVEELFVVLIAVLLEATDHEFLLLRVHGLGLKDHGFAAGLFDVGLHHAHLALVFAAARQHAQAPPEADRPQAPG